MEIKDNRTEYPSLNIIKGKIVDIYNWKEGITITLDTGYDVELSNTEIERIAKKE